MARTAATLAAGSRITDLVTVGVIARTFPIAKVRAVLAQTGRASVRERELPAHVVVYYVITLALFMNASCREVLRCLLEGVQWLSAPRGPVKVTSKSGISQARTRLGSEVMRRLHDEVVRPIATAQTKGAWFRRWRLVSLDGSTFDVADDPALETEFGRPGAGHGESAFPQVRIVCLVENGTHVLFATKMAGCATSELALAREVLPALGEGMLCLADRNFFGFDMWALAQGTGAELVWRVKQGRDLPEDERLADGSYLSRVYPGDKVRKRQSAGIRVRVIDYRLYGVAEAEPMYRLVTTILDPAQGSAQELAALYHERWEIETALGELKTHLRGARIVLRSKTPDLVRQEIHGLLMAHFAIRGLMHEAALGADEDPDRLSFLHAVRVIRRKISAFGVIPPSQQTRTA
jgi:Insertion element 4 transposase N-terminal/Transposase DDE domain